MEFQKQNVFKAPPKEWVKHRLENLHEALNKNTTSSALTLKDMLGIIKLEPISEENEDYYGITGNEKGLDKSSPYTFHPYYIAHTKIQTLVLLDDREKGANWSRWWRRSESNRRP